VLFALDFCEPRVRTGEFINRGAEVGDLVLF